jgi:hypothetical protein
MSLGMIGSIQMFGKSLAAGALLAIGLTLHAADGHGQAADRASTTEQGRTPAAETLKERLSDKASDEQRVDNCKVPKERRGTKPRPRGCATDQIGSRNR